VCVCVKYIYSEAQIYQNTLKKSGYNFTLQYEKQPTPCNKPRRRNIIWFNLPISKHVATNIGRQFLNIIGKVFHSKHLLRKIFNRNALKLNYSCMPNIMCKINKDNKRKLANQMTSSLTITGSTKRTCNCIRKSNCPLNGKCLLSNIIYQATITSPSSSNTYIGLCETNFKKRL